MDIFIAGRKLSLRKKAFLPAPLSVISSRNEINSLRNL